MAILVVVGCGRDLSVVVGTCKSGSDAREIEALDDSAAIIPRMSIKDELLPAGLSQGINPTMTRAEIEVTLATYLRSRGPYSSEFETPLGRLRWSLDHEYSGGEEAKVPRLYLYPNGLYLRDIFSVDTVECLQKTAPKARDIVVMRRTGDQIATLVVKGLLIEQVIWRQEKY